MKTTWILTVFSVATLSLGACKPQTSIRVPDVPVIRANLEVQYIVYKECTVIEHVYGPLNGAKIMTDSMGGNAVIALSVSKNISSTSYGSHTVTATRVSVLGQAVECSEEVLSRLLGTSNNGDEQ